MNKRRVLVVDDVAELAHTIADDLRDSGFDVQVAHDGQAAFEGFLKEPADVVVTAGSG